MAESKLKPDSYNGNHNVKKDGVVTEWLPGQVTEYHKCMNSAEYFCETYCKVIHMDSGLVNFNLYPYQKKMFEHFDDNRFSIVLACRQSGKSMGAVGYLLWYALFHSEKTVAILANKGATAREMIGRITLMLENLPFFLQAGCKALNKGSLEFSNNSRILAAATSGSSIRGFAVHLLYLDEFAFVENATEFYTSTYPVVTSGTTSKVIITSTANGVGNMFHKIWSNAILGNNDFKPLRVDWWDVPGRDEAWKEQTIANTSQLQFDQEYGNNFFGTGNTLFDPECLMRLTFEVPKHITTDGVKVYREPIIDHFYVMAVDVSKGRGLDYTTFTIIDLSSEIWQQVAVFRDNRISPYLLPTLLEKFGKKYNDALIVVESNDVGQVVCNGLYHDIEYENVFMESVIKADSIGINMNRKVKRLGCAAIKDVVETGKLEIHDETTIDEMSTFEARGVSYEATDGNYDDLVMNLVLFGYLSNTTFFSDNLDINFRQHLHEQNMKAIEDDVLPFGIIDDGLSNDDPEVGVVEIGDDWLLQN